MRTFTTVLLAAIAATSNAINQLDNNTDVTVETLSVERTLIDSTVTSILDTISDEGYIETAAETIANQLLEKAASQWGDLPEVCESGAACQKQAGYEAV